MTLPLLTWSHVKCTVKVLLRLRLCESEFRVRSFSSHLNVVLVWERLADEVLCNKRKDEMTKLCSWAENKRPAKTFFDCMSCDPAPDSRSDEFYCFSVFIFAVTVVAGLLVLSSPSITDHVASLFPHTNSAIFVESALPLRQISLCISLAVSRPVFGLLDWSPGRRFFDHTDPPLHSCAGWQPAANCLTWVKWKERTVWRSFRVTMRALAFLIKLKLTVTLHVFAHFLFYTSPLPPEKHINTGL